MPPDNTGAKQTLTQFKPGQSGNLSGRPKGSRNKLAEAFLADLHASWEEHGREAINRVIQERPQDFLKVVASILPKEISADVSHRFVVRMPVSSQAIEEWEAQHVPKALRQEH